MPALPQTRHSGACCNFQPYEDCCGGTTGKFTEFILSFLFLYLLLERFGRFFYHQLTVKNESLREYYVRLMKAIVLPFSAMLPCYSFYLKIAL